jgi:GT2 family glycosyltransferase/spore maturation protein CgeB
MNQQEPTTAPEEVLSDLDLPSTDLEILAASENVTFEPNRAKLREISPTIDPGLETGLCGYIDSIDAVGIAGWLIDLGNVDRAFRIDAHLGGLLVSSSETYIERADVGGIVGRPAACGFSIPWDSERLAPLLKDLPDSDVLALTVAPHGEGRNIGAELPLRVGRLREWLDALPRQPTRFMGRMESVSPYRIAGFVFDRTSPNTPVALEILLGGEVVAEILADVVRTDLKDYAIHLSCGFEWLMPHALHDGKSLRVDVRVRGRSFLLPGSGVQLNLPSAEAGIKRPVVGLAMAPGPVWTTGWVADTNSNEPLSVELLVDGQSIGRALAGTYGAALDNNPDYPFENVHTCFSFPTPSRALDGWVHEFRLRVVAWGAQQPAKACVRWAHGNHFGNLERCAGHEVSGWVAFRAQPAKDFLSLPVEIFIGGKLAAQCFLGETRTDVVALGNCQFAYRFQGNLGYAIVGPVSARYAGIELRGSSLRVVPAHQLAGNLDGVARDVITGWAANVKSPDDKIELELVADGQVVASFRPNCTRPDVNSALGLASSKVGFVLATPELLLDGEPHRVEVRFSASKNPLPSRVAEVRFKRNFQSLATHDPHPVLSEFISPPRRPLQSATETPVVSIVVLNRNGEDILNALLSSFVAVNSFERYEFIVVDHASKDASVAILNEWSARGVPITIIPLPYNGSFSGSNNLAIREFAKGEYVLLLNNDIVFVQDVLPTLVRTLQEDPRVGLAGIKLLDVVEDRGKNFYPPIQHLGIRYGDFGKRGILPYDEKLSPNSANEAFRPTNPAGVTGAAMLCRRTEYLAIGGLDETYFYGYEDVDLCLKYRVVNQQEVVCRNDLQALHHRGYSRLSGREMGVFERLDRNHLALMERWGYAIRNYYRRSLMLGDRIYSSERLRIAFAVTETGPNAVAGDYFTAMELARALAEFQHVEPVFLSERDDWYDLGQIHVLVVMRHDYDLRSIESARSDLVKVAWLRNHFESWLHQRWFDSFDIYLSSAPKFADRLSQLGYRCDLVPIATNIDAMAAGTPDPSLRCVAGFNGSAWSVERGVVKVFEEAARFVPTAIVGSGWQNSSVACSYRGLLPYERMPDFYASAEIIVDDANQSARIWGSANSRVFDALAAGTLVITNSAAASADLFDGALPVWNTPEEALALIRKYSQDAFARHELTRQLNAIVAARHTYRHRAAQLLDILQGFAANSLRIAVKVPVPTATEKEWWGDWHFAKSLKRALKAGGHSVRIDFLSDWSEPSTADDVVIVLRGLSEYTPDPTQINLLWILSHPEKISVAECSNFDHVFSASPRHAAHLKSLGVSASTLLQCADPEVMKPVPPDPSRRRTHLFVGNSRGHSRKIVSDLVDVGVELAIFGREWDGLAPHHMLEGDLIENEVLCEYYGNAGVVYNDHWPDMARWGFLSNRLFDAAACGAYIVSDQVDGLREVFEGLITTYETLPELADLSSSSAIAGWGPEQAHALRELVLSQHTFAHRVDTLMARVRELSAAKISGRSVSESGSYGPSRMSGDRAG